MCISQGDRHVGNKIPESVLVVIHTPDLRVLILERADHPGFWQSVTGSLDHVGESPADTCRREVMEETGIDAARHLLCDWKLTNRFEIYAHWRHRYPAGVTHNTEHVFGLMVPDALPVTLAPREHLRHEWLDWRAAAERCFSWTNVEAIRQLPERVCRGGGAPAARPASNPERDA